MRVSQADNPPVSRGRIEIIDIARTVALFAMVVYHFTWDLEFFSYVERGLTGQGGWRIFARCIASSFLFLVGVSLVLANDRGIRWQPFLKRLAQVMAGALAITAATLFTTPNSYVYFGILHHIAVASLLGLLFLRLPWPAAAAAAIAVVALPFFVATPLLDPKWLNWIGMYQSPPLSNDFVPLFPFFGAVLAGIAAARLAVDRGLLARMRGWNDRLKPLAPLGVVGRHSLMFYLLHQPILFGLVFAFAQVAPADRTAVFRSDCQRSCVAERDQAFCERYCACAEDELQQRELFDVLMGGDPSEQQMSLIRDVTRECAYRTE
ncbi:heparan-alpha-glucosaminide N-acetyltransferase [Aurantimonas sp. A2-1-M11]|uniref:heparan-alpha-glucosaminide N-acetyltransferase n=1 Tax=Aurantimonas sp. A2-1-M11 TaxID=3113712 RepID=UPI002F954F2A